MTMVTKLNKSLHEKTMSQREETYLEKERKANFQSETHRLCSLLGLKFDFLDCLEKMPQEHRNHREEREWIQILLEEKSESLSPADKTVLSKELLQSLGFDPSSKAIKTILERSLRESKQQHIEACEWTQIFIDDEFKYNPELCPGTPTFPFLFQSTCTNEWVSLPTISKEEIESNIDLSRVKIMNLVTEEYKACNTARNHLSALLPKSNQHIFLYHGTDHESARQILLRGIYLGAGRQKRDFSCGKGFYLTNGIEDAFNWAKSTTAKPAILIFAADRHYFSNSRRLSLNEREGKWREIVSSFRTASGTATTQESLKSYDLIEGPTARVTTDETSRELVFEPKPSSYQMCLISDDFAESFEKNLHSIFFFDIS